MFCPNCGGKIEGKFCGTCGAQIPDDVLQELKKQEEEEATKKVAESEVQSFKPEKNKIVKIDESKERRSDIKGTIAVAGLVVLLVAAGAFILSFGIKNADEFKSQAKEITSQVFKEDEVIVAEVVPEVEGPENKDVAETVEETVEETEDAIKSGDLLYKNTVETKAETKVETKAETKAEIETEPETEIEAKAEEEEAPKAQVDIDEIDAESIRAAAKIKTQELIASAEKSGAKKAKDAMASIETSGEPFTAIEIFD